MAFDRIHLTPVGATADGRTRWLYRHPTDLLSTILGDSAYFDGNTDIIKQGDAIVIECLDGTAETFIESTTSDGQTTFDTTPWTQGFAGSGGSVNLSVAQNPGDVTITPSGGGTPAIIGPATAVMSGALSSAQALQLANLGTAASRNVGLAAGNLPELDGTGNLPAAVLNNAPGGGGAVTSVVGQTGAVTAAQIVAAADAEANTNFLTDAERVKLTGIETAATADQTNAEIEAAYNAQVALVDQATAEAGASAAVFRWSPQRVGQAIAALAPAGGLLRSINAQAGAAYTLAASDIGGVVRMTAATANAITIPANATVPIGVGAQIDGVQGGAGVTTITAAAGVTLNGVTAGSGTINARYDGVSFLKVGADEWDVFGAIGVIA